MVAITAQDYGNSPQLEQLLDEYRKQEQMLADVDDGDTTSPSVLREFLGWLLVVKKATIQM